MCFFFKGRLVRAGRSLFNHLCIFASYFEPTIASTSALFKLPLRGPHATLYYADAVREGASRV